MFKLEIEPQEILHTKWGTAKIGNNGYYMITSAKEGNYCKSLHNLIYEDFYGPIPEGCLVHHKDGNKLNNCLLNLELLTHRQHKSLHHKDKNHSEEHCLKINIVYKVKSKKISMGKVRRRIKICI